MTVRKLMIGGFIMLPIAFVILAAYAFNSINDKIDRCDDSSSGKYIWDDARRAVECPRRLPLKQPANP